MAALFSEVRAKAESQIGVKETPAKSNMTRYGQWYGLNGVPWCAIFISWCFSSAGWIDGIYGKSASVSEIVKRFKAAGRYGTTPKVGALGIFEGSTHIELITSVGATSVYAIGGNTSSAKGDITSGGQVAGKYRSRSKFIGYCYPEYAAPKAVSPISGAYPLPRGHWYGINDGTTYSHSGIRGGSDRTNVQRIQAKLKLPQDGNFGPKTRAATIAWQKSRSGLTVDGKVGPATWAAMSK